eukprot:TRINITY_DN2352_c0_g1_i1.p1 TRINITY_DN2352_c0_g1~~TRINITY_DN2352_c0_g1_i1.p1  ORF type:complete len:153 (+),score=36.03 TRINITY_DN2352_c0_g1_i1:47-505(+)
MQSLFDTKRIIVFGDEADSKRILFCGMTIATEDEVERTLGFDSSNHELRLLGGGGDKGPEKDSEDGSDVFDFLDFDSVFKDDDKKSQVKLGKAGGRCSQVIGMGIGGALGFTVASLVVCPAWNVVEKVATVGAGYVMWRVEWVWWIQMLTIV